MLLIICLKFSTRFDPPLVPKDFVPHHKFVGLLETGYDIADPSPPEVSPPEDNNLKLLIEGVATLVARCGKLFEDLSREKNKSNPLFSFLVGGNGHGYYMMKLWEAQQKQGDKTKKKLDGKLSPSKQKMNAESRGKILGERPLEQSSKDSHSSVAVSDSINVPYSLSDTFTKPASYVSKILFYYLSFKIYIYVVFSFFFHVHCFTFLFY